MTKNCSWKESQPSGNLLQHIQLHHIAGCCRQCTVSELNISEERNILICFPILSSPLEVILNLPRVHKIVNSYSSQYIQHSCNLEALRTISLRNSGQQHTTAYIDITSGREDMSIEL